MNGSEPAFPVQRAFVTERDYDGQVKQMIQSLPGLTVRAAIAKDIMAALCGGAIARGVQEPKFRLIARDAVEGADALIAELAKGEK